MIHLRSEQLIEHVHGGGEEHALARLASSPANQLRKKRLAHAGISNNDNAGPIVEEFEIKQAQDAGLQFGTTLVVFEVEGVNGWACMQPRETETPLDGAVVAGIEFEIGERFQCLNKAEVPGGSLTHDLIELPAHRRQIQLVQLGLQ